MKILNFIVLWGMVLTVASGLLYAGRLLVLLVWHEYFKKPVTQAKNNLKQKAALFEQNKPYHRISANPEQDVTSGQTTEWDLIEIVKS